MHKINGYFETKEETRILKKQVFLSLTILWVIFIYLNSFMNAYISSMQSGFVLGLIQGAAGIIRIPPDLITEHMVRKSSHFFEYALLGFLMVVTAKLWYNKLKPHISFLLFLGLLIPVSDEFLQIFIVGRTGAVQDVVLDFAGFVSGAALCILCSSIAAKYKKKRKDTAEKEPSS